MTQIVGLIKSPAGIIPAAKLRVTLDGDLLDTTSEPSSLVTRQLSDTFTITNGVLDIELPESSTSGTTYFFELFTEFTVTNFFFLNGASYTGPTHLHTDGKYYTGNTQTSESVELIFTTENEERLLSSFHEIVPNVSLIDFTDLVPTGLGIGASLRSTGAFRIAQILTTTPTFIDALSASFDWRGAYNPTTRYSVGDAVSYAGSSWTYINPQSLIGVTPSEGVTWSKIADRGAPGGTGGEDTAYDEVGWNGDLNAPSKNVIRDLVETELAKQSQIALLAPLANPTFTGNPSAPTPPLNNVSQQLTTTEFVVNKINERIAPFQNVSFKAEKGGSSPLPTHQWVAIQNYTAQVYDDDDVLDIVTGHFTPRVNSYWRIGALVLLNSSGPNNVQALVAVRMREVTNNEIYLLHQGTVSVSVTPVISLTCSIDTDILPSTSAWVLEVFLGSNQTQAIVPPSASEKPTAFYGQRLRTV